MLILYYAKGTAALAPHILLEEVGADYETRRLDFTKSQQQSTDYLAVNPKGRVPTLETPQGTLTETPAILAYISQIFPAAGMAPQDPFDFARAQAFNLYVASTVHVAHAHKLRGTRWADDPAAHESMRAKVTENMVECGKMIEKHYLAGRWVLGDNYSMCDPYLFLIGRWIVADGGDMDDFPAIKAHSQAMRERASVRAVLPLHS